MQIKRKLESKIQKYIGKKEIIVITGIRRAGKTTLMRMIYESLESDNKVFLDIDNILDQKIFEEVDFNNIWMNLTVFGIVRDRKAYIFLDEIQTKPEIVKSIKYLYDHYNVKFFVTGSSSFYLKNLFPESLSGRKIIFELFPLDFEEFLHFKGVVKKFYGSFEEKEKFKNEITFEKFNGYYNEYFNYGGFPQVVLGENEKYKKLQLKDIFHSYFEKDVRFLADFKDINKLRDLILLLIQRVGSKIDISKLASELKVARDTIYSYLSFLEGTYFIFLIKPFSRNVDREVSGRRKVYLCDNGFINHFGKVSEGALFENSVFLNIKKYNRINYYQKRGGREIDFLLENNDFKNLSTNPSHLTGIEVKLNADSRDITNLQRVSTSLGLKNYFIVSKKYSSLEKVIPVTEL
jgi:uncharacterized protein